MDGLCIKYQQLADVMEKICVWFAAAVLMALLGVYAYSIIADLCLPWPAPWLEEVCALLFSWTTFIGAGVIVRRGGHVSVDILTQKLKAPALLAVRLLGFACICWVAWAMVKYGYISVQMSRQTTVYLDISMKWAYLPIAISGILLVFFGLAALLPHARKSGTEDDLPPHLV
jgi:TRAP-type C4-dicarboxylate transport system permease small subunit